MKAIITLLTLSIFSLACTTNEQNSESNGTDGDLSSEQEQIEVTSEVSVEVETDEADHAAVHSESITIEAMVLAVKEELIMPDDYLTTNMTVVTTNNDTLQFVDMEGCENLIGQTITIHYAVTAGAQVLVCFDCTSFSEKISVFDVTAFPGKVEFKSLKLKNYEEDEFIDVASVYTMINDVGETEHFRSNTYELIEDSVEMKSDFHSYGLVTMLSMELLNRGELKQQCMEKN